MRSFLASTVGVLLLSANVASAQPSGPSLERVATAVSRNGAAWLVDSFVWLAEREATHMLAGIAAGPAGGGGKGAKGAKGPSWYRPSETRFTWDWLAARMDDDGDGAIDQDEFLGPTAWFEALDRDRDGKISPTDFDWSADSKLARASQQAKAMFSAIDADRNGQVSIEEWQEYMKKLAKDKKYLSQDDLLPLFLSAGGGRKFAGSRGPKMNEARLQAFSCGDVGSWLEGPALNGRAPNFSLRSPDGKSTVTLSDSYGSKPVVLVFGSFT